MAIGKVFNLGCYPLVFKVSCHAPCALQIRFPSQFSIASHNLCASYTLVTCVLPVVSLRALLAFVSFFKFQFSFPMGMMSPGSSFDSKC